MPALLFDLDGTLVQTDPLHAAVFAELFAERGQPLTEADYLSRIHGRQNADIFGDAFPGEDIAALADQKEARFRARLGASVAPMPGLPALVDRAEREGWPTAVVTNAPAENAAAMLAAIGMADRLTVVVLGDDCPRGKPAPDPYLEAMRRLGVAPADCLAFEDSRSGIVAAAASGACPVGLSSSLSAEALRDHGARLVIRDFTDPALADALDTVSKGTSLP